MIDISEIVAACGLIATDDSQGTGYLIGEDQVATCAHVVENVPEGENISIDFNGTKRKAKVRTLNKKSDCALLVLTKSLQKVTPLRFGGRCKWKAPWDSYGFGEAARGAGVTLAGIVSNPDARDDLKISVLELTAPEVAAGMASPLHGFSGSPVIVDDLVVGHLKRFIPDPEHEDRPAYGKVYATPSECVLNLMGIRPGARHVKPPLPVNPPAPGSPAAETGARKVCNLLEKWSKEDMPKHSTALVVAESLVQLGHPTQALRVLKSEPKSIRGDQLTALALAKTKKPANIEKAIAILKELRKAGHLDGETGGILAGRYKQKWQQSGNKRFLREAFSLYLDTFKRTKDTYPGINAAAMALQLQRQPEAKKIASQVLRQLKIISPDQMNHWQLATVGEAYLLSGNLNMAKDFYTKAVARYPEARENISTMHRQARLNLKALGLLENALEEAFSKE